MSQKLMPRLGSAIASTILSLCSAVSLVGVDKAQAAVLTYNFQVGDPGGSNLNFFKVNNSSLTGIGEENIAVSEGRFYDFIILQPLLIEYYEPYYNLAGGTAVFYQGDFRGLQVGGSMLPMPRYKLQPSRNEYGEDDLIEYEWNGSASWSIATEGLNNPSMWTSRFSGYAELTELRTSWVTGRQELEVLRKQLDSAPVSYTLVDIAAEPVPEPLTAAGTALALAGLSWLKHKKKMAA